MRKSTRTWLWIGGGAAVLLMGGVAYAKMHAAPAAPSGTLPAGSVTPTTSFMKGLKYTIASTVPAGITDVASLTAALTSAGWSNVTVPYFAGSGNIPAGFEANSGTYVATGTWGGADNTPVPTGVVAAATP